MRIALVTGASRGLGLETCRQLSAGGDTVVLTARTPEAVAEGVRALGGEGPNVIGAVLDIASDASVEAFFERFWADRGRVDVLVNNAGRTFGKLGGSSIRDVTPEALLEAFDNNAVGAYRLIRRVLPMMNRNGYGRIVNVSTGMAGLSEMNGGSVAYRVSKTALNAITRVAHAEAGPNVKVNSVCPGWVRTDMGGSSATRSLEQGASGIVWAAKLPDDGPTGGFFRDGKRIAW